jgi:hypothetical protein
MLDVAMLARSQALMAPEKQKNQKKKKKINQK